MKLFSTNRPRNLNRNIFLYTEKLKFTIFAKLYFNLGKKCHAL